MVHGSSSRKPSLKSMVIGSQPLKPVPLRNSNQSARKDKTTTYSVEPPTQGNQGFTLHPNTINLSHDQGSRSQPGTTHLHNETSGYSSITHTGDNTEPEDNDESSNANGPMNLSRTLRRSRLDSATQDSLAASILEAAAAQGFDVESIVGARPNQASGPTKSVVASLSVATAPSSPVLAAGHSNTSMAHELASHLAADSISITQDNVAIRPEGTVNSIDMSEDTGSSAHAVSALTDETSTSIRASPVPTNEIFVHVFKANTSGSFSIRAPSVFATNGVPPSALACSNQPGFLTSRSGPNSFFSFTAGGTTDSFAQINSPADHTVSVFGSNASSAFQMNASFQDCNTWNGSSGNHSSSVPVLNQSPDALNGRFYDAPSWSERPLSSSAAASRPSFSDDHSNIQCSSHALNLDSGYNNHDRNPFAHTSNFDFIGVGHFNIDAWPSPSDNNLANPDNNSSSLTYLASNDVEMNSYDPSSGCYGIEGLQISSSSFCLPSCTTDIWNGLVIPPFSLHPNVPNATLVTATSDEQEVICEAIDVEMVNDPFAVPFRQRLAPPPVELSSMHLDPQLDWVQVSSALSSPENPAAAAVVYDNFSTVMPSSFDDPDKIVQYIPFPFPISGRLRPKADDTDEIEDYWEQIDDQHEEAQGQPHWIQTDENEETKNQLEWGQMMDEIGFCPPLETAYPLSGDAIGQTDSPFQHTYHQPSHTSCFRPLKKLATAIGWAVHHYIGHRVHS